ncbi:hypothetical protein ACOMHN_039627 [Nucella lapillus]
MDEAPTELRTTKKQTSIADFFSPRLQGLPSREEAEANPPPIHQAKPIKEEQMSDCCGEEEMYVDFDIPGPTPSGIYSSQNSQYHDFDMPAPTPSPLNPVPDSLHDHSFSYAIESPNYGEPGTDNLQTPAFLSSQGMLGDSQETDGWGGESQVSGRFQKDVVPSLGDDLQTPSFLMEGCGEDSGSGDMF